MMFASLRTGTWLTAARLRVYPRLLLALFGLAVLALWATSDGRLDRFGRPLGTDFSDVWTAGIQADAGAPAQAYDRSAHFAEQAALFGPSDSYYVWPYPPLFLAVAAALALLPYLAALTIWQAATLPFYLLAIRQALAGSGIAWRDGLVAALAFPAVFINLAHGHNGFLTAGLLAGGLALLRQRPVLAGVLFGLLAYKPQLALALPVALLAGREWRALVAAVTTVAATVAATIMAFGWATWAAFFANAGFTRTVVLEQGAAGWEKMQSVFAAARLAGFGVGAAYAVQAAASLAVLALLAWCWHRRGDFRLKAAALLAASLLAAPYNLDYDLVLLGPALALAAAYAAQQGFQPFEKTIFAAVWLVPLLARALAGLSGIALGSVVVAMFFVAVTRRARTESFSAHPPEGG